MRKLTRREVLFGSAALSGAALAGTSVYQWTSVDRVQVNRQTLFLPRWDADGFRVGLVSDLHIDSHRAEALAIDALRKLQSEKVDVILMAGDTVSLHNRYTKGRLTRVFGAFAELGTPVYKVYGNHEYWIEYMPDLFRFMERLPVPILKNEMVEVDGVRIFGLDDALENRWRPDLLGKTLDRNTLVMLHEPDFVDELHGPQSLCLSGHSHGGQVCLPFGVPIRLPRGARTYVTGFYDRGEKNMPVFVSRGVGTVGLHRRAFCPAEVNILTLKSSA